MATTIMGGLMVAMALWLARYDLALKTVRSTGLTRYIAVCLPAFHGDLVHRDDDDEYGFDEEDLADGYSSSEDW